MHQITTLLAAEFARERAMSPRRRRVAPSSPAAPKRRS